MNTKIRTKLITLRISDEEYKAIHMNALRFSQGNMSDFIRMIAAQDSTFYTKLAQ